MNKPGSLSIFRVECNPKPCPRVSILRNPPLWVVAALLGPLPAHFPWSALGPPHGMAVGAKVFFRRRK